MTDKTYTLTEARAKLAAVFPERAYTLTDDEMRKVADLFGLTVKEPKTEPGVYLHDDGRVFDVSGTGTASVWYAQADSPWVAENRDKLEPARVMTEADYTHLNSYMYQLANELQEWKNAAEAWKRNFQAKDFSPWSGESKLTLEQVGKIHDKHAKRGEWIAYSDDYQRGMTALVNAALAEHGYGAVMPSWEQVHDAIQGTPTPDHVTASIARAAAYRVVALFSKGGKA